MNIAVVSTHQDQENPGRRGARRSVFRLAGVVAALVALHAAPAPGQIYINEFMASNTTAYQDPQGHYDDWIELYNAGGSAVDVGGMYMTDDLANPRLYQIPAGSPAQTTIPSLGYLVLWADNQTADGPVHLGFALNADGEAIGLYDSGGVAVDTVTFGDQARDVSFGRFPDGDPLEWRFFDPPSPNAANTGGYLGRVADTKFSVNRGIYSAPFSVAISSATPNAQIYYTLDGTEPTQSSTLYANPIPISGTTVLRARAYRTGWLPTNIDTHTYVFLSNTIAQSDSTAIARGFPVNWTPSSSQSNTIPGDYEVDPNVTGDTDYSDHLTTALTDLPVLSVSMPIDSWFGYSTGLISNAPVADDQGWERACSAEMFYPDGREAFHINCAIRLVGGTSPNWSGGGYKSPKHSFRLKFKDEFGPTRLRTDDPILPGTRMQDFNTLVLDARMNNTWHYSGGVGPDYQRRIAQYLRDQYANDMQNKLGDVSPHGLYAHVYFTGVYWGVYCIHERPDEAFMAEYWGGEDEDYDALKHNSGWAISGTNADYLAMFSLARSGMADTTAYETLITQYLDLDPFINYMLLNFWGGNRDWAHQNWYAGRNSLEPGALFRYYSWDAEKVVQEPGDNVVGRNDSGGPTELHHLLAQNPEYVMRFADRAHKLMKNGGLFTENRARAMYEIRANEIYEAVIMESARWGDRAQDYINSGYPLYTRDDWWIPELNRLRNNYFPFRADTVLGQLRSVGLYPDTEAPVFNINGLYQHGGTISSGAVLTMDNPNAGGTIYYTLDGSDPRRPAVGGTVTTLVAESDSKRVLVPTGDIGTTWRTDINFDDTGWTPATGGVGYDRNPDYDPWINLDVETEMYDTNGTCYIRIPFTVDAAELTSFASLSLKMNYDDGFIAYLNGNGTPIYQVNPPGGTPAWNSTAGGGHEATGFQSFDVTSFLGSLQAGDNFLAIHGLNTSLTSSDFLISVELEASTVGAGGGLSPTARNYSTDPPAPLTDTTWVRARVLEGATWSALNDAVYQIDTSDYGALRVSEVMYHPADPPPASYWQNADFEFIEITNTGSFTLDLTGVSLTDGVYFTFNDSSIVDAHVLAPGEHIVVVKNELAFRSRYGDGVNVAGRYFGSLDNAGEWVRLTDPTSTTIVRFRYNNSREWPQAADGAGHSLVPLDSALAAQAGGSCDYGGNWRASTHSYGSPGTVDPATPAAGPTGVVLNEVAAHTDYPTPPPESNDWIELYNTTAGDIVLNDCYLSDSIRYLAKWQIPNGTVVPAGGRLSFDEINDFHNPAGFGLDKDGERAVLSYLPGTSADRVVDEVRFKGQEEGVTLGRYSDGATATGPAVGSWRPMAPSRDGANTAPFQEPVINQFMYHPDDGSTTVEYVEIHNPTAQPIDLWTEAGPWRLTGGVDYQFQTSVTLPAGGYLLFLPFNPVDPTALNHFMTKYGVASLGAQLFGPWSRQLSDRGERVALERPQPPDLAGEPPSWVIVDETFYFHQAPFPTSANGGGHALHRVSASEPGPDPTNWVAAPPDLEHTGVVAPLVANEPATSITHNAATLNGTLTYAGGEDPTVRIYWGTSDGGTSTGLWQEVEDLGVRGVGDFSAALSGLTASTDYYFRAHAENTGGGTWASATASFTTLDVPPSPPSVEHQAATSITQSAATLHGEVLDTGGENPTVRFFWGVIDGGTTPANWASSRTLGPLGVGAFSAPISGLSPSTLYYYQVSATNSAGTDWGTGSGSFTTLDPPPVVAPGIRTLAASNITHDAATLNGEVTDTGGENPTVRVYWGTTAGGHIPGNWEHTQDLGVASTGPVSVQVTGLAPNTLYFCRFYAENSGGGTWASAAADFTTTDPPIEPPLVTVSPPTQVAHDLARVGGEVVETGGEDPSVRIYYGTTDGGHVPANWQDATLVGQLGAGLFETTLYGLRGQTRYYYRAFAQNSAGGAWSGVETFVTPRSPGATSVRHWWYLY